MRAAAAAQAGCVFFGNKYALEKGGEQQVNIMDAKDAAANSGALAVESSDMKDAVRMIIKNIEAEHQHQPDAASQKAMARSGTMSQVFDRVSNMFGGQRKGNDAVAKLSQVVFSVTI